MANAEQRNKHQLEQGEIFHGLLQRTTTGRRAAGIIVAIPEIEFEEFPRTFFPSPATIEVSRVEFAQDSHPAKLKGRNVWQLTGQSS